MPQDPTAPLLSVKKSHHVAFSPDAKQIVTASGGKIWEIASGKETARCELPPNTSHVAWSPTGKVIAMQNTSGVIRLCDAKTGKKISQMKMTGEGNTMSFSPDGCFLAAGDWDGNLFTWSGDGKLLSRCDVGAMIHVVSASTGAVAAVAGEDAIGFDAALETERWRTEVGEVDRSCLHLANEEWLLVGWNGDALIKLSLNETKKLATAKPSLKEKKYAKSVAISPDGRYICAIHSDEFILFDDSLRELGRRHIEYANAATFSRDSQLLAIASWNKGEIWRVESFSKDSAKKTR